MRRTLLFVILLSSALHSAAQVPPGNQWIDYSLQYWKFSIVADGLYRIDSTALADAGFPITTIDPQELMVFGREQQVPIYIEDGGDGVLNGADFIEFQAKKNDGWLDAQLYAQPSFQPNPYYSLYNDTINYFITWSATAQKERVVPYVNTDFAGHTPRPWYWGETISSLTGIYRMGYNQPNGVAVTSGFYVEGEGRLHQAAITSNSPNGASQPHTILTPRAYQGPDAPDARVSTAVASLNYQTANNLLDHHSVISYGPAPGTEMVDSIFNGVHTIKADFDVPASALGANLVINYKVPHDLYMLGFLSDSNYTDYQDVSNTRIRYAKEMHMYAQGSMNMWIPQDPSDPIARVDFTNFSGQPIMYAYGDSVRRVIPTLNLSTRQALFPTDPSGNDTYVFLHRVPVIPVGTIKQAGQNGYFTDFSAVQEDSAQLIVTHSTLMQGATAYANYRENMAFDGSRYNVVIADVDELYDQFGGGIPKHAIAIRKYCKFAYDTWDTHPKALLLIGKSVQTAFINNYDVGYRPDAQGAYARCLVPSYGYPSSDVCFTLAIGPDPNRLAFPVGRISAYTDNDVYAYRDKVSAMENQPPAPWMKNILHFRGGTTPGESATFAYILQNLENIAVDTCFGGVVTDFVKSSSDVFEQASADSVKHFIEDEGVTLMTFLSHAYGENFEVTIDNPANYDWNGKHPAVLGLSCYIGNIHLNSNLSAAEKWVLMPAKGPIAFMSTVISGYPVALSPYALSWYESFSRLNYGGTIGDHMAFALNRQLLSSTDVISVSNAHAFTLSGDPLIRLNSPLLPDYSVSAQDIYFDPDPVTADADTFLVKAVVRNIGKATNASFNVALDRDNPGLGAITQTENTTLSSVYNTDTAYFHVATQVFSGGAGVNQLTVRADLDPDVVPELDDLGNNVTSTSLFITSGDLVPVYPYAYAIVPDAAPILKASTGDPLAPPRIYLFEIDTTDLFNSPIREATTLTAPGGVVNWQPQAIYNINTIQDSTVFFWRCTIDSTGNGGYNWYERSFQYIEGKSGWGQAHYFQFKNDHFNGVVYDRPQRDFDFFTGARHVRASVRDSISDNNTGWYKDNVTQEYNNGCQVPTAWMVAIIDPITFEPWETFWTASDGTQYNADHQFGNMNNNTACRDRPEKVFSYNTTIPAQMVAMQDLLENQIPLGHHVLMYTWRYMDQDGMQTNNPGLMPAIENLSGGNMSFASMYDSAAYILYVQKGFPATFQDTLAPAIFPQPGNTSEDGVIDLSVYITGQWNLGSISSVIAGPASAWHALYWNEVPVSPTDSTTISLIGVREDLLTQDTLMTMPSVWDSVPDLSSVDAGMYPYLKISGSYHDLGALVPKPAQQERWQLLSSQAPECAIDPPVGYVNGLDDLFEGQNASLAIAVHNIGEVDMDSLLMTAWVIDRNNIRRRVHYKYNAPLLVGGILMDTIVFSTLGFGGPNTIIIEANPEDTLTSVYDQLEQTHINNIAQLRFNIEMDIENPLLDVTFDGIHILDGDIVSAKPEIYITLDDENPVLLMNNVTDTTLFQVFMKTPNGNEERLYFRANGMDQLLFEPSTGSNNICHIRHFGNFEIDGTYELRVRARDLSNNNSGDKDLMISFEVINKPTITETLNYPNPFTTSTRFVFTVTGSQPPTNMKIQIMTVTGRVVREIKMHELGPIHVGRNITEYAWDGTDEFGDKLARGVYIYRVISQLNGQEIEYRETGASDYFKKGFGKMYKL